jgi:hypothetical protein
MWTTVSVCDIGSSNRIKKITYTRNLMKKKYEYKETRKSKNEQYVIRE